MQIVKNVSLLNDERVRDEINRHRWIESEKAGTDIGFERAALDWLARFSDDWIKYNVLHKHSSGPSAMQIVRNAN